MNKVFKMKLWDNEGIAISKIEAKNINDLRKKVSSIFKKLD